jgi:fluoroquinolone transport system permease protein
MATSPVAGRRALAAFGRNDVRGTYRDPLLVMIVVAPIIWTLGVVVLTPLFTQMLAERYEFDLVPYYPLVLTAFLLLTSIIIAGGLGAFLVLDEVDAGTLTALRVTPVPLSTFFAYRAGTVMVVTTVYVVATMSLSGILEPALIPALIPIGLLAGLSGVVTLLLIVAVESNKIQGLALVRARHADRRPALSAVVHRLAMEPRLRGATALLGGQGVLGRRRPRHLVALPCCRRRLQRRRHLAAVPPLPRQEHLNHSGTPVLSWATVHREPGRQFVRAVYAER